MTKPIDVLLHFTRLKSAQGILNSGQLRLNEMFKSNDFHENINRLKMMAFMLDAGKSGADDIMDCLRERDELIDQYAENIFSVSLSRAFALPTSSHSSNDWIVYAPSLGIRKMWGQYADGWAGACLVFDRQKLIAQFEQSQACNSWKFHFEVEYLPNLVSINSTEELSQIFHLESNFKQYFKQKHIDWNDEQEYRFIEFSKGKKLRSNPQPFIQFEGSLLHVLLGPKNNPHSFSEERANECCVECISNLANNYSVGVDYLSADINNATTFYFKTQLNNANG